MLQRHLEQQQSDLVPALFYRSMQWHIEQAASAGASENEILEALEVGIEMSGGGGTV